MAGLNRSSLSDRLLETGANALNHPGPGHSAGACNSWGYLLIPKPA